MTQTADFGRLLSHNVVVLVDDDPEVRRVLKRCLQRAGLTVETAGSIEESWPLLEQFSASVIILDLDFGTGMSGLQALKLYRQRFPSVEIIVHTGHATVRAAVECMGQGVVTVLEKGNSEQGLLIAVGRALERQRSQPLAADLARLVESSRRSEPASRVPLMPEPTSVPEAVATAAREARLTPAEIMVLERIVRGLTTQQIAEDLDRSVKTIEGHTSRLFTKFGVARRSQLISRVLSRSAQDS